MRRAIDGSATDALETNGRTRGRRRHWRESQLINFTKFDVHSRVVASSAVTFRRIAQRGGERLYSLLPSKVLISRAFICIDHDVITDRFSAVCSL